ncbi:MAG: LPS export ABC transporter permease LptG [Planctomycetota bacterium]
MSLDRYVLRIVAGSWLATLLFFVLLTVLLDLLNNLGGYLENADERGLGLIGLLGFLANYYLQLIPVTFVSLAPFVTVIACMFALARLLSANEIVPMVFVGRSMFRVLRPMLQVALIAALAMAACWQWAIPALRERLTENSSFLGSTGSEARGVVLSETFGGIRKMLYVGTYDHAARTMQGVMLLMERIGEDQVSMIQAEGASWDETAGDWRLEGGSIRKGKFTEARDLLGEPGFLPDRIWKAGMENLDADTLSYSDLAEMRRLRPNRLDVTLALHRHITYPLANLLMLLLALPFAIHFERGSRVERTIGAIGVCGAYFLIDLTCQSLGQRQYLHPVVAAWLPTILFGSLGGALFSGIRT